MPYRGFGYLSLFSVPIERITVILHLSTGQSIQRLVSYKLPLYLDFFQCAGKGLAKPSLG